MIINIQYQRHQSSARAKLISSLLVSLFERGNLDEGDREQVREMAVRLGRASNLEAGRIAELDLLARVYDLGKVSLPDSVLHGNLRRKEGELTEAERETVNRHPETGYRIAIAYSAMTSPRPYAQTFTHEEALAELKRCAGSQFDPALVEMFLQVIV
jgi:HD-GYP domain-containing protein (c-di-GMP phosphodiesterase class II)